MYNILIFIILQFGFCAADGRLSQTYLSAAEDHCPNDDATIPKKLWAEKSEIFVNEQKGGIVHQFLIDLEQGERQADVDDDVDDPFKEKYADRNNEAGSNTSSQMQETTWLHYLSTKWLDRKKWSAIFGQGFNREIATIFGYQYDKETELDELNVQREEYSEMVAIHVLQNDANILKRAAFFGGQCARDVSTNIPAIKEHLNLALDLVAKRFDITHQIEPMKSSYPIVKIMEILATKWREMKNFEKTNEEWNKKGRKYVEELLKFLKGFLDNEHFELLRNSEGHKKANGRRRRRRRRKILDTGMITLLSLLGAFVLTIVLILACRHRLPGATNANNSSRPAEVPRQWSNASSGVTEFGAAIV